MRMIVETDDEEVSPSAQTAPPLNDYQLAAVNSRLPPSSLSPIETALYGHLFSSPIVESPINNIPTQTLPITTYLKARNLILIIWLNTPTKHLTLKDILGREEIQSILSAPFAHSLELAFAFLHRHRFINFGVLPRPVDESKPIRHRRPRIVIIGAGMAGLSTARELINLYDGYPDTTLPEIILLEGRKRVGGRVTSFPVQIDVDELEDMDELEDDDNDAARPLPRVELGAQIITGFKKGNPLRVVVRRQLQLDVHYLKNAASSCILYDQNGDPVNHDLDAQSEKIYNHILDQASNTVIQEGRFQALPSRPTPSYFDSHRHLDIHEHVSLGRMFEFILHKHLKHNHLDSERLKLIHWHLANAEFSTASTADDISLYHWDQDDGFAFDGYHSMVKGGFCQVPQGYANGLKGTSPLDIRYDKNVLSVNIHDPDDMEDDRSMEDAKGLVKIVCQDGSIIRCDAAVITVPLGVLKSKRITFNPPLPRWKTDAINGLKMGFFNKLVLVFPCTFWDLHIDTFGSVNSPRASPEEEDSYDPDAYASVRGRHYLFWNLHHTTNLPILVSFISGDAALKYVDTKDSEIVSDAMSVLRKIFETDENHVPDPVKTIVTRWGEDPFAFGSYSSIGLGSTGKNYDQLGRSLGQKVFWAGEATCREYPATVHGAMISGMRVASEIGDALLGRVSENLPVSTRGDCPKGCRAIIPPNESIFDHMKLPHVIPPIVVPLSSTEDDEEDPLSGLSPDQSQSEGKNPFDAITCLLASRDVKCQEYHWILNQWWSSLDESQKALVIRREGRPD